MKPMIDEEIERGYCEEIEELKRQVKELKRQVKELKNLKITPTRQVNAKAYKE